MMTDLKAHCYLNMGSNGAFVAGSGNTSVSPRCDSMTFDTTKPIVYPSPAASAAINASIGLIVICTGGSLNMDNCCSS